MKKEFKKTSIIFICLVVFIALICIFIWQKIIISKNLKQIEFTQDQLENYYKVYQDPFVLHLRKALNGYLAGTNEGIDSPELVISAKEINGVISGLAAFDKDYYQSKFIVWTISDSLGGGKEINIIFQDKPDKIFWAWVYKTVEGQYDLRGFSENKKITTEELTTIRQQYKKFLNDPHYAL